MMISAVLLFNVGSFPDNRGTITPSLSAYSGESGKLRFLIFSAQPTGLRLRTGS
jgi:hypothetical protein